MGKAKGKEVLDDDEALEEDPGIESTWSLEERQRVAERIEASGTPLGLPDAAFDAPSMVQDAYAAMLQKSPGIEVMMGAILQAARRMDEANWQRFQQIPLLHTHQDDATVHSNLFAQTEPTWRPLMQRPKKRKQSCDFFHIGTAPMTAALADFLTKLGWSGVCVGPSKPPPGNEDLLQWVNLDPAEAQDQLQIDELLGETGGLVPRPPTFPLAFVNVIFNVNEDATLLDPYDEDYEEKLKARQEKEEKEAEAKKESGKKKKKEVVQENAEMPPVPPSTVAGYGVVGLTRSSRVRRRLRALKNSLAISLGRLAKDGTLVVVWPGLPLHPVLFFIAGSLRKLFQRVHVFSPDGSKTFEIYILAAGYKRDRADSKVPGMGGLEIRSFFEDTWRCDGLDDVLMWTLAPFEEDEETNVGLIGKSMVLSYTQLWKTWGAKLTSLALDLGMLLGQDDGAAMALKRGSKGNSPTRSKRARAKEKAKAKPQKQAQISPEEPAVSRFEAGNSEKTSRTATTTTVAPNEPKVTEAAPAAPAAAAAAPTASTAAPVEATATSAQPAATNTSAGPAVTTTSAGGNAETGEIVKPVTSPEQKEEATPAIPGGVVPGPAAAGPVPAGPAGVRRRAAPGTRLPPMEEAKQKIDPVEATKTRRWRVRLKRGGMPQLSCSLGAAPGHKYRQPDFQELAEQYPLIHKALEVARHGKQKHWDLDAEDSRPASAVIPEGRGSKLAPDLPAEVPAKAEAPEVLEAPLEVPTEVPSAQEAEVIEE